MTVDAPPEVMRRIAHRSATRIETIESVRAIFADDSAHPMERMYALQSAWTYRNYPTLAMPREEWVRMFRQVGYFEMDERMQLHPAPRPPRTARLYRGASPECARGMSWAPTRSTAAQYGIQVWAADVPSEFWLAVLHEFGKVEVVVDLPPTWPVEVA